MNSTTIRQSNWMSCAHGMGSYTRRSIRRQERKGRHCLLLDLTPKKDQGDRRQTGTERQSGAERHANTTNSVCQLCLCACVCVAKVNMTLPQCVSFLCTRIMRSRLSDTDTCRIQTRVCSIYCPRPLARRRSRSTTPGTKQFVWLERRVYSHGNVGDQGSLFVPRGCHAARPLARVRMVIIQEGQGDSNLKYSRRLYSRFLSLRLILVYSWLQTNDQRAVI